MNKKMFFSGLSIASALVLVGGVAFAQYVLTASASGNTFSSSAATLEICNDSVDGPINCAQSITSPIASLSDLVPGVPESGTFWLENTGTGPNDNLINLAAIFGSGSGTGYVGSAGFLYNDLNVSISCTDTVPDTLSNTIAATSFGTYYTTDGQLFSPGTLATGATAKCQVTAELPASKNDLNQSLGFSATFGANFASPTPTPTL